ncbi:MAG TPA: iron-sulfur cluster repair di-iron protein [Chitinophagaceae bacterium]|nr:iron-sulfur cluster repair di-iron protein [Chitinophagaceae bacterium]
MTKRTIGSYVAEDYRAAAVFNKYGIDFCCRGGRTIEEVCTKKELNSEELTEELEKVLSQKNGQYIDFKTWPLDLLADYIEKTHHRYVEENSTVLLQFLDKLCKVHGQNNPELFEIHKLFNETAQDMAQHMKKEELILFPFIHKLMKASINGTKVETPHFGSVENPVNMMMEDHDAEGVRFRKIAKLSDNYNPPADACNTYRVTYAMLKEFEDDLHKHIHLENNILFPAAIKLEEKLNK